MIKISFPIAAALALLALTACETANQTAQGSESIQWNTPRPGDAPPAGTVAPPPAASPQAVPPGDQTGPQCREYQSTAIIGGKEEKVYGRACRQPDGTWKNVGALSPTPTPGAGPAEASFPYGWYGYEYPSGPRYGPGYSVGVGAGTRGGYMGYGVGF